MPTPLIALLPRAVRNQLERIGCSIGAGGFIDKRRGVGGHLAAIALSDRTAVLGYLANNATAGGLWTLARIYAYGSGGSSTKLVRDEISMGSCNRFQ